MSKRAAVTEAEARRAIKAALACGLTIYEVIVKVDGIRILTKDEGHQQERPEIETIERPRQWS